MFTYIISSYIVIGILTIILMAYDPYTKSFDFGLSEGWEFFWWQRYLIWLLVILLSPIFLIKEITNKLSERKNVKEWHTKGSFIRKL